MEQVTNLFQVFLILLSRAGMLLVHINIIPSTNVNLITIQHILSITVSTFCYLTVGYRLSWIQNIFDFSEGWLITSSSDSTVEILHSWRIMILCEGLISVCIAGRAHFTTSLVVSFTTSSIIQPLMTNLITDGTNLNSLGRDIFDFEDSTKTSILHIFPAGFSFTTSLIFGQRIIKIKDMDLSSVPINAHSTSFLGYIFIMVGFMPNGDMIKNLFAFSTGMLTMLIIFCSSRKEVDYWCSIWVLQGGCAAVIGNVQCFKPYEIIITASCTTILYASVAKLLRSSRLEDYFNVLAIHGIAGSLPLILIPVCQTEIDLHKSLVGAIFSFTVFSIGIVIGVIVLIPLKALGLLRSVSEAEIYNQKWLKENFRSKKRGIQPGEHTMMKMKNYMDTEHGHYEGRVSEL